jgi:DNA topoisomerase-1
MKLLIVESPAKAKTISKYLDNKYEVKASVGHIRDLPKNNKKAIDIENGFLPHYEIIEAKKKVINELRPLVEKSDEIVLATDPDREGEAIAWHISEALNLDKNKTKRITFNEITKEAVREALTNPRDIDTHLLKAQEARRVLDRLVGYDLSGLIWKKVRYGLSAGRVQSPALRIIMEREREIRAFKPEKFYVITAKVEGKGKQKFILTCVEEPRDEKLVEKILKVAKTNNWIVKDIKETEAKRSPQAPFITSTLQQTASSRLGFSPSKTMALAQKLYEKGSITYMRTDSIHLSKSAKDQMKKVIESKYGKSSFQNRIFKDKTKNAQEAHEAIRPTNLEKTSAGTTMEQKRLYDLIWKRTIASHMPDAKILRTKILVEIESGDVPDFAVNGSRLLTQGWLEAYPEARGDDVEVPKIELKEKLKFIDIQSEEKETLPPPRYSEARLIKELEKRGIGRPSTYASIIKTLKDRGYVDKVGSSLQPTDTGDVVSSFLEDNFMQYINDSFTAEMENELDDIAKGEREYAETLEKIYTSFKKSIDEKENIPKITNLGEAPKEFKCPTCGEDMIIKLSKAGKFMSCKNFPDCQGARNILGEKLEGIKEINEDCPKCKDGKLIERDGRFGRFIACNKYPKCKYVKQDKEIEEKAKTGVTCPVCKKGEMVERRGRFGIFYSCSEYPDCKYAIKAKPTGKICKYVRENGPCGKLMMEGTKTIPERCSDKACPNHNPHKLEKDK